MGPNDGMLFRIRAVVRGRYISKEIERFAYDPAHALNIVRGFKGRHGTVAVFVEELQYDVYPRDDMSFRREG